MSTQVLDSAKIRKELYEKVVGTVWLIRVETKLSDGEVEAFSDVAICVDEEGTLLAPWNVILCEGTLIGSSRNGVLQNLVVVAVCANFGLVMLKPTRKEGIECAKFAKEASIEPGIKIYGIHHEPDMCYFSLLVGEVAYECPFDINWDNSNSGSKIYDRNVGQLTSSKRHDMDPRLPLIQISYFRKEFTRQKDLFSAVVFDFTGRILGLTFCEMDGYDYALPFYVLERFCFAVKIKGVDSGPFKIEWDKRMEEKWKKTQDSEDEKQAIISKVGN